MSFKTHALREFKDAGWLDDKGKHKFETQKRLCENALELLDTFSKQGHYGSTGPYVLNMFTKLARYEPISPPTSE